MRRRSGRGLDALDLAPALPEMDEQARKDWEDFRNGRPEAKASAWRPLSPPRRRSAAASSATNAAASSTVAGHGN
eukprot:11070039-Alexandrium_andersonii.AAC.1